MAALSDGRILTSIYNGDLSVTPIHHDNIQPASIDLTLDNLIQVPQADLEIAPPYPSREEISKFFTQYNIEEGYTLKPNDFVLGQIKETLKLSNKVVGNIVNRNSIIRLGVNVGLSTYINPGYEGKLPIAIHNTGPFAITLVPGMRICQLVLFETRGVLKGYGEKGDAKYQGEQEITLSKLSEDSEFEEFFRGGKRKGQKDLVTFLSERIKSKSQRFFEELTPEQRQAIGLE